MESSNSPTDRDLVIQVAREFRLMSSFDALFSLAVAERIGMHNTDIETLDLLNVLGPMTAGQLSERTGLTTGATTRLIDRLEHAGYARRVHDETDRRRVIIEPIYENLTEVGELYMPLAEKMAAIWSRFSDEELAIVLRLVRESNAGVMEANANLRADSLNLGARPHRWHGQQH